MAKPKAQPAHNITLSLKVPATVTKALGLEDAPKGIEIAKYAGVKPEDLGKFEKCMSSALKSMAPVGADLEGVARTKAEDGDAVYALFDIENLGAWADDLTEKVFKCSGIAKSDSGKLKPRVEMVKLEKDADYSAPHIEQEHFEISEVLFTVDEEIKVASIGQSKVAKSIFCPMIKADMDRRLVTGIVLQPEVVDAQGDIISSEVIEQAAHNFLRMYNKVTKLGLQHKEFPSGVHLVESYITPAQFTVNKRQLKKGTWMATVYVEDDEIWAKVKDGTITGFSIGGLAKAEPASDEAEA